MPHDSNDNSAIETIRTVPTATPASGLWTPCIGERVRATLDLKNLPNIERQTIERQTTCILGKCISPNARPARETGLALGYVQSGKTLSFTCVAAMANDNRFPLIIVITGTSVPLYQQSVRRLRVDLGIDNPTNHEWRWQFFTNPNSRQNHLDRIRRLLAEWQDPRIQDKQTCLIAVMKNHRHLANLVELLQELDVQNVPALVIDDEADQAGLNTLVKKNDESRTYQTLLALRDALPHHTYLQYTATPQAPLLINIIDVLSPRFVEVLEPGRDYVGVIDFFRHRRELVRTIPDEEIPSELNHIHGAPASLQEALRLFFIGVAIGNVLRSSGNRSMLVHPSRLQAKHANYYQWVSAVRNEWLRILGSSEDDPDRIALIEDFRQAHANLCQTAGNIPGFEQLGRTLWQAINRTHVWEVNARLGKTPEVVWQSGYSHILVGGQAMDRGFTVEGLTVTYMPRGRGVGNADTIQQRARFLGYKRSYIGLCRVFLEGQVQQAYTLYVDHEENLRKQLAEHAEKGRSLAEWRRAFFLDSSLAPTRRSVLDLNYDTMNYGAEWFYPRAPHFTGQSITNNCRIIEQLTSTVRFNPTSGHAERTTMHCHGYAPVALEDVYNNFLTQIQFAHPTDSQQFTGLLLQIKRYLERTAERGESLAADIYLMSWTPDNGQFTRQRSLDEDFEISSSGAFFQGASLERGALRRGEVYPGDREIKHPSRITVQIHLLELKDQQGRTIGTHVPAIAVWLPAEAGADTLVQERE